MLLECAVPQGLPLIKLRKPGYLGEVAWVEPGKSVGWSGEGCGPRAQKEIREEVTKGKVLLTDDAGAPPGTTGVSRGGAGGGACAEEGSGDQLPSLPASNVVLRRKSRRNVPGEAVLNSIPMEHSLFPATCGMAPPALQPRLLTLH